MDDSRIDAARETLENLLPEMKIDGLALDDVKFDFYTESVTAVFSGNGKIARLRLTSERMKELEAGRTFSTKHLRDELRAALNIQDDD
jgi:hypothetical protein